MQIALFIGIESENWQPANFQPAIDFAKAHRIDTLLVKVFDGMQGEWYSGQFPTIYQLITSQGLDCIPYGFHYGNNKGSSLTGEAALAIKYGQAYGTYCADMESSWDGQGDWAAQLAALIQQAKNEKDFAFWVSTWANVGDESGGHSWLTNIRYLTPVTHYFLPQAYNDSLYATMMQDWMQSAATLAQIQPTFELSLTEFGANDVVTSVQDFAHYHAPQVVSLWEWQWAKADPTTVAAITAALKKGTSMLTSSGEVAIFVNGVDQLIPGRSEDECVAYALSLVWHSVAPGETNPYTIQDVSDFAQAQYAMETGDDFNSFGMSNQQLYDALNKTGLKFQVIAIDSNSRTAIQAALASGCPVIVCAWEHSFYDVGLGDRVPYQWDSTPFNHCIALTGNNGSNVYVRDTVEVGQAFPPGSQRTYDLGKMQFVSITKVIPSWIGAVMPTVSGVPTGWKDDGTTLTAPNGFTVTDGFRDWVMRGWNPLNYPLENAHGQNPVEASNPSLGNGTQQVFRQTVLEWTQKRGVYESWVGQEFLFLRQLIASMQSQITNLAAQAASLQAQITALEAASGLPALQTVKDDLTALLAKLP